MNFSEDDEPERHLFFKKIWKAADFNQLIRFLSTGGIAFVIYFGMQFGLEKAGLQPYTSLTAAYFVALAYHYFRNHTYTFRNSLAFANTSKSMIKYAIVNLAHYVITLGIVAFTRHLGFDIRIGMVIAVGVTMVTGFIMYRYWVFSI